MLNIRRIYILALAALTMAACRLHAEEKFFRCELGIDGGCGYYVGDATPHIFQNVREAYGTGFRYMFNRRWSLRLKGMTQRIAGYKPDGTGFAAKEAGVWQNRLVNFDLVAEFNFLPYGSVWYDSRIKPVTPYIATGIGLSLYSKWQKATAYMPFIVGMKWRCSPHCTIHLAWEHDVYFADNLEGIDAYGNTYRLNGTNLMNMDVTGQLVAGVAIAFLQDKKVCRTCK